MAFKLTLIVCCLCSCSALFGQHALYFKNGRVGLANELAFKTKTIVITDFDNPRAPLEIPKTSLERIVLTSGDTLTSDEITQRRTPAGQLDAFVWKETRRVAADDGAPRLVAFASSNFLDRSITLTKVEHTAQYTILTFVRRKQALSPFIISSATYLYNRKDVRQVFRLVNAGDYTLDVPVRVPASTDSLYYSLTFERVTPDLETISFRSLPIAAGFLGGPVGGFTINDLVLPKSPQTGALNDNGLPGLAFATGNSCITCGNNGYVRCPTCSGVGTIHQPTYGTQYGLRKDLYNQYRIVTCPTCAGAGRYVCPNRPNHPEMP